ncbi:MAG: aspartyl protease family protein [Treponema sp.]|nr:aspartyl protease family protein [Treponema sp.]
MGEVNVEITLKNGADIVLASDGHITEQKIRSTTVTAVVDTGAMSLVIGDELRNRLGLAVVESRTVALAGGSKAYCKIAEPVQICWKDRISLIRP